MTPDEIIANLDRKFFVAYVRDLRVRRVYARLLGRTKCRMFLASGSPLRTLTAFRKRFPKSS